MIDIILPVSAILTETHSVAKVTVTRLHTFLLYMVKSTELWQFPFCSVYPDISNAFNLEHSSVVQFFTFHLPAGEFYNAISKNAMKRCGISSSLMPN
jgi:hypothetical protein